MVIEDRAFDRRAALSAIIAPMSEPLRRVPHLFDLDGRVALVTGAGSGLGREIAVALDAYGAQVIVADVNPAGAEQTAATLSRPSPVIPVDVREAEQVRAMLDTVQGRFERLDIAFLLPGTNVRKPALELSEEEWHRVVDLNLTAMFLSAREVGRVMMEQRWGSIILMASARGLTGGRNQSAYTASKHGVVGLTRSLAWEWAPYVRVNALAPGYMATPLVEEFTRDPERWRAIERLHALDRVGQPEEVAGPAVFLASDASSFVTGSVLTMDAGWTAGAP